MEFLLSLPKTILDLVVNLLKMKKDDRTRQRLADLLSSVAECISAIASSIEDGTPSPERCAELASYIANLHGFVATETDEATANKLTMWLRYVEEVPGLAEIDVRRVLAIETKPPWSKARRFEQAEAVRQIAGLIRGTANLVRV
jgi:predicted transcriptional regulator